jgi:hypothetical protein
MIADRVPLRFAGSRRTARLRELTGRDEYAVSGVSTPNAIGLLTSLLDAQAPGEMEPIRAADLVAADRDRLLAVVYERAFGDRIESTLTCARCAQPFDLHFSLQRLIETVDARTTTGHWKALGDGRFEGADGASIRLPTGNDELAAAALSADEVEPFLRNRAAEGVADEVLEEIAPLLDLELVARCAECGHTHAIQFDIQSYLLSAILTERRRLLAEINRIAAAYAWSLDEILSLSRTDRRVLVELIENERVA